MDIAIMIFIGFTALWFIVGFWAGGWQEYRRWEKREDVQMDEFRRMMKRAEAAEQRLNYLLDKLEIDELDVWAGGYPLKWHYAPGCDPEAAEHRVLDTAIEAIDYALERKGGE